MGETIYRTRRPIVSPSHRINTARRPEYLGALQDWNTRLSDAHRSIRILEAIRWNSAVESEFFSNGGRELPAIRLEHYRTELSRARVEDRIACLRLLEREIAGRLGTEQAAGRLLLRRCRGAQDALRLIAARGTREFVWLSREVYGSSLTSRSVRDRLLRLINFLEAIPATRPGEQVNAETVAQTLQQRLDVYFGDADVRVRLSDALNSDACAGSGYLKVRRGTMFRPEDIDLLEAHEGWVHLGSGLTGKRQPIFTVLSKSSPGVTSTQEGLAVLTELLAGVCHPARRWRLASRLRAVLMAEEGADFLQVYRYFHERLADERSAYRQTTRIFRGSLPSNLGPFTKDLSYGLGLLDILSHLRTLADEDGRAIPLLFSGKTCLDDLSDLGELHDLGLLVAGEFVPPPFRDRRRFRQSLRELGAG